MVPNLPTLGLSKVSALGLALRFSPFVFSLCSLQNCCPGLANTFQGPAVLGVCCPNSLARPVGLGAHKEAVSRGGLGLSWVFMSLPEPARTAWAQSPSVVREEAEL